MVNKIFSPGRVPKEKVIATLKKENVDFLDLLAKKYETTISATIDEIIDYFKEVWDSGKVARIKENKEEDAKK